MGKRLTQEEVEKYYLDNGYELLSEYHNARTKNKIRNIASGKVYYQTFDKFKNGRRPENIVIKFTQEEVEKYYLDNGYELLSEYEGVNIQNKIRNIKTGNIYKQSFNSFKNGHLPENIVIKFTQEEVEKYYLDNGYELLSEYEGIARKNRIKELKTGKIYTQTLAMSRRGSKPGLTKEDFEKKVFARAKLRGYTLVSKYKGMGRKNTFKCPIGHIFEMAPYNLLNRSQSCPHCSRRESKGETFVRNILIINNINYEQEKTVTINGNKHRFDFVFFINNTHYVLEYNGLQHYKPIEIFNGKDAYKNRVIRDKEKYLYCIENNMQLVSIPYIYDTPQKITRFLRNRYNLNILPYDKNKSYMDKEISIGIAQFYLTHSIEETRSKYSFSKTSVFKIFKQVYGMTKTEYLKQHPEVNS